MSTRRRKPNNKKAAVDPPIVRPPLDSSNSTEPIPPSSARLNRIGILEALQKTKFWFGLPQFWRLLVDATLVCLPFFFLAGLYFFHDNNTFVTFAYNEISIKWLCGLIVALFVLSSFGMLDLLRIRFICGGEVKEDTALIGNIIAAAGIFYALVMGVIATATWDDFKLVSESVQKEVGAAGNMFEFAEGYPVGYRNDLRAKLIYYVSDVLVCDWDAQKGGKGFGKGHDDDLGPLITQVIGFDPKSSKETTLHPVLLGELGKVIDAREARARAITGVALPEILWVVVAGCSLIVLLMVCWGPAQESRLPLVLVGGWGALVGFVVFLTLAMDHPLWGELSVSKDPYAGLLDHWKNISDKNHAQYEIKKKSECTTERPAR
jgi:Protein of unknown function (DUF4239)